MSSNPPPISLGKPSLRHRLESYYSLVAPAAIADAEKWKRNFETIHAKYGGTVEGETRLATKLAKKYGERVRLLVAPPHRSTVARRGGGRGGGGGTGGGSSGGIVAGGGKCDESHYEIDEGRRGTRILDFASPRFDPFHALNAPERAVVEANPAIFSRSTARNTKLDDVSKFRTFLPECDPQRLEPSHRNKNAAPRKKDDNPAEQEAKRKKAPLFLAMASRYEHKSSGGPLSLLYSIVANRQRARVMVRYVDCVRGTLTGYLLAFDKHFNMILRDVDEVYGGRVTRNPGAVEAAGGGGDDDGRSNSGGPLPTNGDGTEAAASRAPWKAALEAQRRRCYPPDGSGGPGPAIKQRYFHQLMVRGDNVVMVWRAEAERSTHPRTNKSPDRSLYQGSEGDTNEGLAGGGRSKVGTPGSLYYALQRWEKSSSRGETTMYR